MKDREIIELLSNERDCNFIGIAVTPWHAHGIDVAIDKLNSSGVKLRGFVFAIPFPNGKRTVFRNNFIYANDNIRVIECSVEEKSLLEKTINNLNAKRNLECMFASDNTFYVVRPSYPDFNWINIISKTYSNTKVCFISIDEGCGSYMIDNNANWVAAISDTFKDKEGLLYSLKISILRNVANARRNFRKTIEKQLSTNGSLYYWRLLKADKAGLLSVDEDISKRYNKVFLNSIDETIPKSEIEIFYNSIIISMAPSFEQGTNVNDADIKVLSILLPILKKYKNNIVIKTHPRETDPQRYSRFGVSVSHISGISQELLISKCQVMPRCVISIDSTTLITVHTIFNIPAIGLAKLYLDMIDDKDRALSVIKFINTFSNIIEFPATKEALETILDQVLDDG